MPFIHIETNQAINDASVPSQVSSFMATLLNKPEKWMMVSIADRASMMFGGQLDPAAVIQLKSIGLNKDQCKTIAPKITSFFEALLNVSGERMYIDMIDIDPQMFAWNGTTFG
ncbi:MAG: hypothetical protein HQK75_07495 [Candidatus Magnetomorum sp.]|nr:hypothetical protein [Candidatus Magnetomorum sp.]